MSQPNSMLATLLQRGDQISLDNGKLAIKPKSNSPIPSSWLNNHSEHLIREIITTTGRPAYWYTSFDTGKYKADGVCLQFVNITTGASAFCCFNAILKRQRNSKHGKAGSYLPNRQFTVGKNSSFCQFWQRAGLPLPNRLGKLYERMGNLKKIVFTANFTANEKLDKQTLTPLTITYEQLISTDNLRTSNGQEARTRKLLQARNQEACRHFLLRVQITTVIR